MPNYIVTAPESRRHAGGANALLIFAANVGAARTRAEAMLGQVAGEFADYDVTAIPADATGDCVIECSNVPVGTRETGNIWPRKLNRGGNPLAI